MSTRTNILSGGIAPTWNGAYGLVAVRKRIDIATIVADFGAIVTGDVFNLFTMPAGFKPVQSTVIVIEPNTNSTTLTVALGASTYGLTTARDAMAAAGTIYDNVPAAEAILAAETTAAAVLAFTGAAPTDGIIEVVVMGFWLGPLPGDVE